MNMYMYFMYFHYFCRTIVLTPLRVVKEEELFQQRILVSHHAALKNKVFAR